MAIESDARRRNGWADMLSRLLHDRGLRRFGLFGLNSEGHGFPGGESASGHVIDEQGRIYFFWMDWDEKQGEPALTIWQPINPEQFEPEAFDQEFRRTRIEAGLRD